MSTGMSYFSRSAAMSTVRLSSGSSSLFWVTLAAFALTILFVSPLRETAVDDDWGYALTVEHLLQTGSYRSHGWLAANMPFQAYWGSLFAHVLGYSFTSLRISTLALVFPGLIAFYFLAREHHLNAMQAGLAMLALCASPLVVRFSFSFNTDVPFLMCFIIALFLYTRAIKLESYPLMFLGSIAAGVAILTRQFGFVLPAGVFFVWALHKEHRGKVLFYSIGLLLPVLAVLWQLSAGILTPTWIQRQVLYRQGILFANIETLLSNIIWRPAVILHYLALFSLPFVLLASLAFVPEVKQRRSSKLQVLLPAVCALYLLGSVIYGHLAHQRPWILPYIDWEATLANMSRWPRAALTLVTFAGATLYARMLVLRYSTSHGWEKVGPNERLLDLCTLFLLVEHVIFRTFGDRYLLGFLPFILIVVGRYLGSWLNRWRMVMAMVCLAMLVTSAVWTRGLLVKEEAEWMAAESVRAAGIEPKHIFGNWVWNMYHGATDDYMAEIGDSTPLASNDDLWLRFLPQRREQAQFLTVASVHPPSNEKWELIKEVPYRDSLFRLKHIYVVKRETRVPLPADTVRDNGTERR
jgi:Dolichyl-phosphate-mannose-protein mannosyltransferase